MTTKPKRRPRLRPGLPLLLAALALLLTIWPGAAGVHAQSDAPLPSAPAGVTAADGPQTGAVNITWNPVAGAAFYRIGWVKMADIPVAQAAGRHWLDAFAFTDIANLGQTAHTLTDLRPGRRLRLHHRQRQRPLRHRRLVRMGLPDARRRILLRRLIGQPARRRCHRPARHRHRGDRRRRSRRCVRILGAGRRNRRRRFLPHRLGQNGRHPGGPGCRPPLAGTPSPSPMSPTWDSARTP